MSTRIHLSPPDVGDAEEAAVLRAIRSGWIAPLGPEVTAFEEEMAARVGTRTAVAVNSGTAALHLALLSWNVGPGDVVIVPTLTFAATANAVVYTGAKPFFVDSNPETGNIDPDLLAHAIEALHSHGETVAAVIPVDLLGKCADYDSIEKIAEQNGIPVLADAAESLGASRGGRAAGSFGRAAVVSFNGNKVMTTSGGGMLLTDDEDLAEHVRYLATQARQPVVHYEHTDIGYNYRLSNVLAALGRAQLARLDDMLARRRAIRQEYREFFLAMSGAGILGGDDDHEDNCWLTAVIVDPNVAGWSTDALCRYLAAAGIESRPVWKPMHQQPVFAGSPAVVNGVAERIFRTGLTLPSGSALDEDAIARVTGQMTIFLRGTL